ncbi:MAG: DsbE family thiol:disulfide interchange protein [Alphaproteobacteria bacterium]|nr:DsbE family thiol:disulfide interchange protein [Alphaproteobacteria bacterium]MCB9930659.1 DsbE family thiol:disulfide interchange protein [Alphaproteobacteria bacterium]
MAKRLIYLLPLLLFAGLAVYLWQGLGKDPSRLPSALIDKPVPEFNLPPLAGREPAKPLATANLGHGKPMLVNFFASWCGPCRVEHPILNRLAREHGVTIQGINYKDKPEDGLAFLRRLGDSYDRVAADLDGRVAIDFGVYGIPETFVIDGQGRVRFRNPGPLDEETAKQVLALVESLQ